MTKVSNPWDGCKEYKNGKCKNNDCPTNQNPKKLCCYKCPITDCGNQCGYFNSFVD